MSQSDVRLTLRLPTDLVDDLRLAAEQHDRTINGEVTQAVRRYLRMLAYEEEGGNEHHRRQQRD